MYSLHTHHTHMSQTYKIHITCIPYTLKSHTHSTQIHILHTRSQSIPPQGGSTPSESVHRGYSWAMVDNCCLSHCSNDHLWMIIITHCCSPVIITLDIHPAYHRSLAREYLCDIHNLKKTTGMCSRETFTNHLFFMSEHTQDLCPNNVLYTLKFWQADTIWNISQVQGTEFFPFKVEEKSSGVAYWWHGTKGKNLRLHTQRTFRSYPRTVMLNQEREGGQDFRSQRLNFMVIHKQKLNLEEFDSEVSIPRKKNKTKQ